MDHLKLGEVLQISSAPKKYPYFTSIWTLHKIRNAPIAYFYDANTFILYEIKEKTIFR